MIYLTVHNDEIVNSYVHFLTSLPQALRHIFFWLPCLSATFDNFAKVGRIGLKDLKNPKNPYFLDLDWGFEPLLKGLDFLAKNPILCQILNPYVLYTTFDQI